MFVATILRQVFSNRNIITISSTNMLYHIFNSLWELWWTLYLIEELKAPITVVGMLATIQNTSRILFQLPGGIIADKVGRKRIIVFGTGMRVIAPIFLLTAKSWYWVIPGMVLNSFASLYFPAFNAIIAESLPKRGGVLRLEHTECLPRYPKYSCPLSVDTTSMLWGWLRESELD